MTQLDVCAYESPVNRRARSSLSVRATSALCLVATFGAYFFTYFFRKAFSAADNGDFAGAGAALSYWGIDYKSILVIAQVLGYMLAKFIGIKVIAEMTPARRATAIVLLITMAQAALLAFALAPPPWNALCMFLNGLPLGIVFGLVLGFAEGRQVTEILVAGLCASFIVADGAAKAMGSLLLHFHCNVFWMPAAVGFLVFPALLLFVFLLTRIPPPNSIDILQRSRRDPMDSADRWRCFLRFAPGLLALMLVYLLMTILRSMRGDFAKEIWQGLGQSATPEAFFWPETIVALLATLANGLCFMIRDNRRAFFTGLGLSLAGLAFIFLAVLGWKGHYISGFVFMCMIGTGLYLPYVAVHTTIFERLIAITRERANLGYLIYLADAYGYLGYVAVVLAKNIFKPKGDFLQLFLNASLFITLVSVVGLVFAMIYFSIRTHANVS